MHAFRIAPLLIVVACGGLPTSECANPNNYRVLALTDGNVREHADARILCTSWSPECGASSGTPTSHTHDCQCLGYALTAEGFRITFPPSEVGDVISLQEGEMTITKKVAVPTSCAQGDYYTDYAGTFEGTFGGHTYERGVFYALEQK